MTRQSATEHHRVVILGGGFSGLGVAIELLSKGESDFALLEKSTQLGGTWRDNTYPGCACDVPSHLYSFSFAPNNEWSRVFAEQAEIQSYLLDVAERFNVTPHVRLETEVMAMVWHDDAKHWLIETNQGPVTADIVVLGAGPLHEPITPKIKGIERFKGKKFHSARWQHDHALQGRRVAVVGTGSSAIQFVPKIQPEVSHLVLFQRTAPWVLPKPDHAYPPIEKAAFRHVPGFRRMYRGAVEGASELLQLAQRSPDTMRRLSIVGRSLLSRQVADPALRQRLTPEFALGCKRLLLSNTYYPALSQPNVDVVDGGLAEVTEHTVIGDDGTPHEVDTIIFGTGFRVTDPPIAERVFGSDARSLAEHWNGSPRAYKGTCVAGFPNLFFMVGPNLGNGHSSVFVLIEAQARYISDALATMKDRGLSSVDVRPEVQKRYNSRVQSALAKTVWNAGGCSSYYLDRNGTNSAIYPWTTLDLRRRLRRFDVEQYTVRAATSRRSTSMAPVLRSATKISLSGSVVAITGGARGIGRACAEKFAAAGAVVVIGDIDIDAARETARIVGGKALLLDVASRASFTAFVEEIERETGPIEVLVNNAGVMPTGAFIDEPDSVNTAAMSINHFGTALGMKLALPRMIARTRGHVVNVASMAGKLHLPGMATYVASKHATVGLSRAVREEIEGTGVSLTTILPGPVRTRLSDGIPLGGLPSVGPEAIAAAVLRSVSTRAPEVAVPRLLSAAPIAFAFVPAPVMRWLRRTLRADRVLTSSDPGVRRGYEAGVREQGDRLADTNRASFVS